MKIESLYIERFGALRDKRLEDFRPDVEVIYAPNESGKTTFIQFVRCMLYGLYAGRAYAGEEQRMSGRLTFSAGNPSKRLTISRILRTASLPTDGAASQAERVELVDSQKRLQSISLLDSALGDVSADLYSQIYAVFQDDLSSFSLLSSEAAAGTLYDISLAQPQTSMSQIAQRLESMRRELINNIIDDAHPTEGRIKELINQRQTLLSRLENAQTLQNENRQALNRIPDLQAQLEKAEEQIRQDKAKIAELERMEKTIPLYAQYRTLGVTAAPTSGSRQVTQYDIQQAEKLESEIAGLKSKIQSLNSELSRLPADAPVQTTVSAPVKKAIPEDLRLLQSRRGDFQNLAKLDSQLEQVNDRLNTVWNTLDLPGECRLNSLPTQDSLGRLISIWKKKDETRQVTEDVEEPIVVTPTVPVSSRNRQKLAAINQRLEVLREKLHWIERRSDLEWGEKHLRNQLTILNSTPVISTTTRYTFIVITALAILGVLLWLFYLLGWLSKDGLLGSMGSFGVALCFCGLAGVAFMRYTLEKTAEDKLLSCQKHWESVKQQLDDHLALQPELEERLRETSSSTDVPIVRLGESQDDLADTKSAIAQLVEQAKKLGALAVEESDESKMQPQKTSRTVQKTRTENVYTPEQFNSLWENALRQAGAPSDWSIEQVRNLQRKYSWIQELFTKKASLERQRQTDFQSLTSLRQKLNSLLQRSAVSFSTGSDVEQIDRLTELYSQQESTPEPVVVKTPQPNPRRVQLQEDVRNETEKLRLAEGKLSYILNGFGTASLSSLKDLFSRQSQAVQTQQQKTTLFQKIQSVLGQPLTDVNALSAIMRPYPDASTVTSEKNALVQNVNKNHSLKQKLESEIEQLRRQANSAAQASNQRSDQQTLAQVEDEISRSARRWRAVAMAQAIAESMTNQYELERQPETLALASEYFKTISDGAYTLIAKPTKTTPLQVQREDSARFNVGQLSTGTREQLYLCLRMALASWYAKQGHALPFLMDDSLANFDSAHVKSAAKLLMDFSKQGIQTILLTCHKSVRDAFEKQGVKTRRF
ncbi:MAG: AAA family ATPase [Thermoguttaceae bacterium]|nr:AAA family ATPase [Thermoguttaceae bacterium]